MNSTDQNLKIKTLEEVPHLFTQLIIDIEKSFHYHSPNSFAQDFYPLINANNWHNNYLLLTQSGELIGHLGVKERKLKGKHGEYSTILLGGIYIHPHFRGMNFLSKLLNHVISKFEDSCHCAFLWSDQLELYKKYFFLPFQDQNIRFFGTDLNKAIETSQHTLVQISNKVKIESLANLTKEQKENWKKAYNTFTLHTFNTFSRNESEWEEIFQISSAQMMTSLKTTQSSLIINKGEDLNGIVHELIAPNSKELNKLIYSIIEWKLPFICPDFHLLNDENKCLLKDWNHLKIPLTLMRTLKLLKSTDLVNDFNKDSDLPWLISGLDSV